MEDPKRQDAADRAPRPEAQETGTPKTPAERQDAPNYDEETDGGRALKPEGVNSANDE